MEDDDDVNIFNFWIAHHRRVEEQERERREDEYEDRPQGQLSDIVDMTRGRLRRQLSALGSVRVEFLHMLHLPALWTRVIEDYERHTARSKMVRVWRNDEYVTVPLMNHYEHFYEFTLEYPDLPWVRLESFRPTEAFPMEMILLV
ncbi:hypothetical protein GCK72_011480 [Caenorhabditis remanei]|uniref:PAZ domain-containing protein n=1 Tax=Caenorhabditis remanei TaxID=31234 RepID=A0A6A5H8U4_CAERE|nr:hypothetical protein GCK72_011480 [Caenorhabditis remanei]KAF1763214.1 hypothetical protein GCK72_011480 [Caenorhabditis remanei]